MNKLRKLRTDKGYTLAYVSKKVGIANNTLSQYETGKREPNLEMLKSLADFYGVYVSDLLGYDDGRIFCPHCGGWFIPMSGIDLKDINCCPYCELKLFEQDEKW